MSSVSSDCTHFKQTPSLLLQIAAPHAANSQGIPEDFCLSQIFKAPGYLGGWGKGPDLASSEFLHILKQHVQTITRRYFIDTEERLTHCAFNKNVVI